MRADVVVSELSIVVVGHHHNPTILNPDFLRYNGIVPEDWDLAEPPVTTEIVARVAYANGVEIVSQYQRVMFREAARTPNRSLDALGSSLPAIVRKYVHALPHVDYNAIGLNPKALVLAGSDETARAFVIGRFVRQGPWLQLGAGEPRGSLKLVYDFEGSRFTLSLDTAKLEQEGSDPRPLVTFAGNFHYATGGANKDQRLARVSSVLEDWVRVHERFVETVGIFLGDARI